MVSRQFSVFLFTKITTLLASLFAVMGILSGPQASGPFEVVIFDAGLEFHVTTRAETVKDLLEEQAVTLAPSDIVFPLLDSPIHAGANIPHTLFGLSRMLTVS